MHSLFITTGTPGLHYTTLHSELKKPSSAASSAEEDFGWLGNILLQSLHGFVAFYNLSKFTDYKHKKR